MMCSTRRETRRRLCDVRARDFIDHFRSAETVMGKAAAEADLGALWALAKAVSEALTVWRPLVSALDVARIAPLDSERAAILLAESVFDDVLTPLAFDVFSLALEDLTAIE